MNKTTPRTRSASATIAILTVMASLPASSGFSKSRRHHVKTHNIVRSSVSSPLRAYMDPDQFSPDYPPPPEFNPAFDPEGRAIECASNFGECHPEELIDLSQDLAHNDECFVEDTPESCEDRIYDRQELAEVLLMQSRDLLEEERMHFLEEAQAMAQMQAAAASRAQREEKGRPFDYGMRKNNNDVIDVDVVGRDRNSFYGQSF